MRATWFLLALARALGEQAALRSSSKPQALEPLRLVE